MLKRPSIEEHVRGRFLPPTTRARLIGRSGNDLAGVPLTSKNKGHRAVAVGTGGWDRSGRPSYAKVDQLIVVRERDVRREGSVLDRQRFDAVVDGVGQHHDLTSS